MALKKFKPQTPGLRNTVKVVHSDIHKGAPYSSLVEKKNKKGGRNNQGKITVRHKGGGVKHKYRIIDFKRRKDGIVGKVERIEYDPNRTALIALILYKDGERRYIIAPSKLKKDDTVLSGTDAPIVTGNCLPLQNIPEGTIIHCVELKPGKGAQLLRSAGSSGQIVAKEGSYATIKLKSGEMRKVLLECRATIGEVSNSEHNLRNLGKAGANRHRGIRPTVRGVAQSYKHPHGGGQGKSGRTGTGPCPGRRTAASPGRAAARAAESGPTRRGRSRRRPARR